MQTKTCRSIISQHQNGVSCLTKLKCLNVISGSWDRTLKIWNEHWDCIATLSSDDNDWVTCIIELSGSLHSDLITGCNDKLIVWDMKTRKCKNILKLDDDFVYCLIQLKNGELISGSDQTLHVWNLMTKKSHIASLNQNKSLIVNCLLELQNGLVLTGSVDCTIRIWKRK